MRIIAQGDLAGCRIPLKDMYMIRAITPANQPAHAATLHKGSNLMANFGRQLRFQTTLRKIFCFGKINAPQQVFYALQNVRS